jgi:tRNA(Ile)-lysidine synthase TilS/MesJ
VGGSLGRYGLELFLLSIDEGIAGYRDDSLETVKRNEVQVQIACCTALILGKCISNI